MENNSLEKEISSWNVDVRTYFSFIAKMNSSGLEQAVFPIKDVTKYQSLGLFTGECEIAHHCRLTPKGIKAVQFFYK